MSTTTVEYNLRIRLTVEVTAEPVETIPAEPVADKPIAAPPKRTRKVEPSPATPSPEPLALVAEDAP